MAAAWVPICKKGVAARNQNILAVSFEFQSRCRADTFRALGFHPLGPPSRGLSAYLERPQVRGEKGYGVARHRATDGGEKKKEKRERERAVCPIKNLARLPGAEIPDYNEKMYLIRVTLNVKFSTPSERRVLRACSSRR